MSQNIESSLDVFVLLEIYSDMAETIDDFTENESL